jgi:hypothetical protein
LRFLSAILAATLVGCATYPEKGKRARVASETGDYAIVASLAGAAAEDDPKDALVWKLEQGAALRALGRLPESVKVFEDVEQRLRAEEEAPGFSLSEGGGSLLLNDYAAEYRAKPYDRLYASTYQALNRLELGQVEATRVSLTRLRFVQEAFGNDRIYLAPKPDLEAGKYDLEKAGQDERTRAGLARITDDLGELSREGTYDDAFSHWLQGMYFLRLGQGGSDLEKARKEFLAASALNRASTVFARDLADCVAAQAARPAPDRVVYVVIEAGVGPAWREERIDIPLFVAGGHVPYISVALPALGPARADYNLGLRLDGRPVAVELASRPEALVAKHFEAALPGIRARAFTSAAVKATASYLINRASSDSANRQNSGSGSALFALATQIGTAVYTVATTHADLRNWGGLPGRFSLVRLEATAGAKLTVPGHPEASLTLPPGKVLLVSLKAASENTSVTPRCAILVP